MEYYAAMRRNKGFMLQNRRTLKTLGKLKEAIRKGHDSMTPFT